MFVDRERRVTLVRGTVWSVDRQVGELERSSRDADAVFRARRSRGQHIRMFDPSSSTRVGDECLAFGPFPLPVDPAERRRSRLHRYVNEMPSGPGNWQAARFPVPSGAASQVEFMHRAEARRYGFDDVAQYQHLQWYLYQFGHVQLHPVGFAFGLDGG